MDDLSFKDSKYFIDERVYNCPFCNRRNVAYSLMTPGHFHWSNDKEAYYYLVECSEDDCRRVSFHLSYFLLTDEKRSFSIPPMHRFKNSFGSTHYAEIKDSNGDIIEELDDVFFHHQPTSFFTVDERIPRDIRETISEADNCRKNNYLTGASACLRKAIYKLLKDQSIPARPDGEDRFYSYEEKLDLLKEKFPNIDRDYFDDLKSIQKLASQELHENDWVDFDNKTIRFLLEITKEVLYHIYVMPDERNKKRERIQQLKAKAKAKSSNGTVEPDS